jgi:alginate O-acetyltransferase complex protein AlgI
MGFSSVQFLFFFLPVFLAAYFAMPTIKAKNLLTLLASLLFYTCGAPESLPVLLGAIAINTAAAMVIDSRQGTARKRALVITVTINLLVLAIFKYAAFLTINVSDALAPFHIILPTPKIALPLGISFFTFHCISYVADVYRGRFIANRNPSEVALYIALFPQLVAGPIVRYKTVARQLRRRHHTLRLTEIGARIFIIGLAQKVIIADTVAPIAQAAFDVTHRPSLLEAWVGLLSYTIQIYFDFGGYSNMAVGLGLILGFSLPRNFRMPYTALSVREFWQRWHMSLSSWLRDYLYIPLGGSRGATYQTYRNLITVFLLCGLWHGASWNFALWGAWHGFFLILERLFLTTTGPVLPPALRWLYTLLAVMGGWVLFRSADLADAGAFYAGLLGLHGGWEMSIAMHIALQPISQTLLFVGAILAVFPGRIAQSLRPRRSDIGYARGVALRHGVLFGMFLLSLLQVAAGTYSPFLYFRF